MNLVWKNTKTLDQYIDKKFFTKSKTKAKIILLGSKPIDINDFKNLKYIYRVGVGKENIPDKLLLKKKKIQVIMPSKKIQNIIFDETASFTSFLILSFFYKNTGDLNSWKKFDRDYLKEKKLLIIGYGKIGKKIYQKLKNFLQIDIFDIKLHSLTILKHKIKKADVITLQIDGGKNNKNFFNENYLKIMKKNSALVNTARATIVNENDLYKNIKTKKISAFFDVFWKEPYLGKLRKYNNNGFYMTPHIASTCNEFLKMCSNQLKSLINEK